jgi:hypothetical protein
MVINSAAMVFSSTASAAIVTSLAESLGFDRSW